MICRAVLKQRPQRAESAPMTRWMTVAVIGGLLGLSVAAPALAAPTITEYGLSGEGQPLGIATGPEGDLWLADSAGAAIDRVTPEGVLKSFPLNATSAPFEITAGPDGKLWFTTSKGAIVTIAALGGSVSKYALSPPHKALGITSGPEGDLWFAGGGGKATIGRIVPSTGAITEFKVPTELSAPTGITVGPEEDLWFTENGGAGAIGRFDPTTKVFHEYTAGLTEYGSPTGITTGPEGAIWFTEATDPGRIGRIDPETTAIEEFSSVPAINTPQQIVAGSDGNLYFTESGGSGAVARITPTGTVTEYTEGLSPKSEPWGITAGPRGEIWFTELAGARVGMLMITPQSPMVSVGAASALTAHGATLNGTVRPEGEPTTYHFEWGASTAYGSQLPNPDASVGSDTTTHAVSLALTGLQPGRTYHFRVVASNATGSTISPDATFTTAAAAESGPAGLGAGELLSAGLGSSSPFTGGGGAPAAAPVIGRLAGAQPESGTILVKAPAAHAFVALHGDEAVPTGSVIDASHGVLRLVTALGHGRKQAATLWGGVFEVRQSRTGGGMTRLILKGALPVCAHRSLSHARAHASSKRRAAKTRQLWVKDNHGRYRSEGAYSATTVLGTEWETEDTCAGTVTRVVKGKVRVRDLHTHRAVLVSAGHSYLARP